MRNCVGSAGRGQTSASAGGQGGYHLSTSSMVGRQHSISAVGSSSSADPSSTAPSPTNELSNATPPTPPAPAKRKDASAECGGSFTRSPARRCGEAAVAPCPLRARPSEVEERGASPRSTGKGAGAAGQKAAMQRVAVAMQRHSPAGLVVRERTRQRRKSAIPRRHGSRFAKAAWRGLATVTGFPGDRQLPAVTAGVLQRERQGTAGR
jgi:hypothetical protein